MKIRFLLFSLIFSVISVSSFADGPVLPKKWLAIKSTFSIKDNIITVKSTGNTNGICGVITNAVKQRYKVSFSVKGQGKVQAALSGFSGMAYSHTAKLNDEWQTISLTYFNTLNVLNLYIYSAISGETEFQVKDLAITPCEIPELADADIEAKLFLPADFPGENGKLYSKKDSSIGKAVWGKRWYNVMKLSVPANSKPLYYYVHAQKDSDKNCSLNLRTDSQLVYKTVFTSEANVWKWVKIGPVNSLAVYPEFEINYGADAKTVIWVDKVVLSTNQDLSEDILNKAE